MLGRESDDGRYSGTPRCRICGSEEKITRHHLIPRHVRDLTLRSRIELRIPRPVKTIHIGNRCNIVKLCRDCHDIIERPGGAQRLLRVELRSRLTPNELLYLEHTIGRHWLDHEYPRA